jgi:hypothetical protein
MEMKIRLIVILLISPIIHLIGQVPAILSEPKHYMCYRALEKLNIDGKPDEKSWQNASWSEYFVDIEGSLKPEPPLKTRVKMLWDDKYLYVVAELEEPHVWATLTERESIIFYDPDFEVFIDPDGDTHNYAEYEMNALNTQWDLLLLKPYRDDTVRNVAIDHWNFNGIISAVAIEGTMNNPFDKDKGWTIEIAFPLDALAELSATGKNPVDGEQYRINFSRVEWTMEIKDGHYRKKTRMVDGIEKPLPEDNWVWSPQGVINMHQPETWGYLQFSDQPVGSTEIKFNENPDAEVQQALRTLYYYETRFMKQNGKFTSGIEELGMTDYKVDIREFRPVIQLTKTMYEATFPSRDGKRLWHIRQDGKIWMTNNK